MNVTGVEWRKLDPHENKYPAGRRPRRVPKQLEPGQADVVEIHGDESETPSQTSQSQPDKYF